MFKTICADTTVIKTELAKLVLNSPGKTFYDVQEFCILFNISKRTLSNWRNNKLIPYSRIGNKYYFKREDVEKLIDRFYNPD
ncbi:MAG: helix-turn-helix domain-containing protein [Candidatus Cloacimonetes bacterium]|nr:helix-turn-helix domain-containing protein [Candidatus Cloacimonadota bacterium]